MHPSRCVYEGYASGQSAARTPRQPTRWIRTLRLDVRAILPVGLATRYHSALHPITRNLICPMNPEATAYHEAGHAVIALVLGRSVQRVSILPKLQTLGRCEFQKGRTRPSEDWLEREILISLAGLAAEARHTGQYAWDGAARDLQTVKQLATQRAGERHVERLQKRLLSKVEHMLEQPETWRAVQLIAAELLRSETISGRAVVHLFEQGKTHADDLR